MYISGMNVPEYNNGYDNIENTIPAYDSLPSRALPWLTWQPGQSATTVVADIVRLCLLGDTIHRGISQRACQ